MKGLLVSESWDLETSRTSTRGGKEVEDDDLNLLAIHILRVTDCEMLSSNGHEQAARYETERLFCIHSCLRGLEG